MLKNFKSNHADMQDIFDGLFRASIEIYTELKKGSGLSFVNSSNASGDDQIGLDVIADEAFFEALKNNSHLTYIVSEERPNLDSVSDGPYSVALDPLDGSKSALVGIPSGAIFGIFKSVNSETDFHGGNIVAGGFFVFGMNLEVYMADGDQVYKGIYDTKTLDWAFTKIDNLPSARFFAVNASNQTLWHDWLRQHYTDLIETDDGTKKPHNLRWYASMVSEIKRLILQGGIFAYPDDKRDGYENGHLRLVYEAIPMAFLVEALGGASSNGNESILEAKVTELHQKTPVFIGEKDKIASIEEAKRTFSVK